MKMLMAAIKVNLDVLYFLCFPEGYIFSKDHFCFDTTVTQKHSKTVRLFQFNPSGSDEANALSSCLIHFNFMYVLVD